MTEEKIRQIVDLLEHEYGRRDWHPDGRPLSTLIETILSQNTSDINSGRAFRSLHAAFPAWEDVTAASADEIAAKIKAGGLAEIKAGRIKRTLEQIRHERGALDLSFLSEMPVDDASKWLKTLPGVGDKTAACVLLFSLGMPALPVDTHILRVSKRLGLIGDRASAGQAHELLQEAVPGDCVYQFHVLMIEHGRRTCKAQRPLCLACTLARVCPSHDKLVEQFYSAGKNRSARPAALKKQR